MPDKLLRYCRWNEGLLNAAFNEKKEVAILRNVD